MIEKDCERNLCNLFLYFYISHTSGFVVHMAIAPAFRFSITISLSQTRPEEIIGVEKRSWVH